MNSGGQGSINSDQTRETRPSNLSILLGSVSWDAGLLLRMVSGTMIICSWLIHRTFASIRTQSQLGTMANSCPSQAYKVEIESDISG